jgi:hypothetical protein
MERSLFGREVRLLNNFEANVLAVGATQSVLPSVARLVVVSPVHICHGERLHILPSQSIFRPQHERTLSTVFLVLLIIGGVESNPGPDKTFGLLTTHSAVHKPALIHDIICDVNLDFAALTET